MNTSSTNWDIFTDLGPFDGAVEKTEMGFAAESRGLRVETEENTGTAGVTRRRTIVRNVSDKPIAATCLLDVFDFGGGEFEVHTQANTWMNESRGAWQPLHTEVAARGGLMMDMGWARDFDSLWLSDNQSPVHGLRIAKETMLRLPPRKIERWLTVRSADGLQPDYFGHDSRLLATEDGWWRDLRSLAPEYVAASARRRRKG